MIEIRRTYDIPKGRQKEVSRVLRNNGYIIVPWLESSGEESGRSRIYVDGVSKLAGVISEDVVEAVSPKKDRVIGEKICGLLSRLKLANSQK